MNSSPPFEITPNNSWGNDDSVGMPSMVDCYYSAVDRRRSTGEMSVFFRFPRGVSLVRSEPQRKHSLRNTANTRIPQTSPNSVQSIFCDVTRVIDFWPGLAIPRGKIRCNPVGYGMIVVNNSLCKLGRFSRSGIQFLNSGLPYLPDGFPTASLFSIENIGR